MNRAFTPDQQAAIDQREGPMLLSANAGSGKTSVLVERLVAAMLEDGIPPAQLLAITFTDKAAGELRSRVRARLAALGERAAARDVERHQQHGEAAQRGDVGAMYLVASIYEQGDGVPADLRLARYWYAQAASGGDEAAPAKLKDIDERLARQPV